MRQSSKMLVAGAVALACAGPAAAQWNGFVSFGDSLSDAGSFKPVLPPGVGRFTTNPDPVWTQVIGERYGYTITPATQGGTNYAQGGARVSGLPGVPAQPPTAAALPIANQVGQYVGAGVNPDAVHAMWGGANDIFFQLGLAQAGAISAEQAQAGVVQAAQQYVQQVGALQAAGVRQLVVLNVPDIGKTPGGMAGGAAASAQITAITGLYNTAVQAGLDTLGGNVLRVDIAGLFRDILANPSAYGFANTTSPACGATPSLLCGPANLVAANANETYVFADGVHPTGAAHRVVADYVASFLEAPFGAGTLTQGPLAVEQATFRTVDGRMWSSLDTPYDPQRGMTMWAAYDYANPDIDLPFASGDADLHTFSVGGDLRLSPHLLAGAAANFSEYKASYGGGRHTLDETSATIYAGWGSGPWYAGVSALVGVLDYSDVRRSFDVGIAQRSESGDTSGTHWGVRLHGGYWMRAGSVNHGPFAKLVWQRVDVDNFAERAGTSTALAYGEQERKSLVGSLGWQAQGTLGMVRPFGRVTWEHEFDDDALDVALSTSLGGRYVTTLPAPDSDWVLFNVGASMDLGAPSSSAFGKVTAFVMGSATAGKGDGDAYGVTLGVKVPF
ncbi:MAG: autotransporter domain-containing protein [Chloroflexi bacterium CFX6]|nr:autotransporter domain-containing protein [Chloroflexi bacterium CFX6]GIK85762.1 MAG: lipase/esterase [Betaproteobacteria bacterium]